MYGKIFESMYKGSMVGSGAMMFAVWPYVIAHMRPDSTVGAQVDLNPKLMAAILGEKEDEIKTTISQLCAPDPDSNSKEEEGRRLVQVGQFAYRVVNGSKYLSLRNEDERREYNRVKQAQFRKRKTESGKSETPAVRHGFQKPTLEEAHDHAFKKGYPKEKVEPFVNYYESNGWKVGRNPMRSWQAAMANWMTRKDYELQNNNRTGSKGFDRNKGTANEGHAARYEVPAANK